MQYIQTRKKHDFSLHHYFYLLLLSLSIVRFYFKLFSPLLFGRVCNFTLLIHSHKKRYKSCHWGCTVSKG